MKLPGFLTPLGILLGALALLVVALVVLFRGQQIFSPGLLSEVNRTGAVLNNTDSHADLAVDCAGCHVAPWSAETMSDRCAACHTSIAEQLDDPNTLHGMLEAANCRDCHVEHRGPQGVLTKIEQVVVDHQLFDFSLQAHQETTQGLPFECADCHTQSLARFEPARCAECHTEDDPEFVALHIEQYGEKCQDCHDGTDTFSPANFDHNVVAFPLTGKHADSACAACHAGARVLADFAETPTECANCHLKDNKHSSNIGTDCARCHTTDGWQTEIFDHDLTAFRLTGAHVEVACADCHANGVFNGTPTDCVACHVKDDAHSFMLGTDCADCHSTENWQTTTFDHNTTGYVLTGAHLQVTCKGCHADDLYAGTPTDCVACHRKDDTHAGQFGEDCAACHTTDTWQRAAFIHTFPLDHGGGGIIPCATCHTETRPDTGARNYTLYTCYGCHDPETIRRQHFFAEMMGTDITNCVRCHPTGQKTMQMH